MRGPPGGTQGSPTSSSLGRGCRQPRLAGQAGSRLARLALGCALLWVLLAAPQACLAVPPLPNCGGARRLLAQPTAGDAPPPSPAPVIETVEVDVVSQECIMLPNSYYEVNASLGVLEVVAAGDNLQDSDRACCASCHDAPMCNAFQWCPLPAGCFLGPVAFPSRGCQLIDLSGFLNTSVNTGQIKQEGPQVPFIAGSPLFFSVPKLQGYDVEIGRNFGGKFNYSCPDSLRAGSCVIQGSAQVLGAACNADPLCLAFSYYAKATPNFPNVAFGVLKGGEGVRITSEDTELNPNGAIYIKLDTGGGSGMDTASTDSDTSSSGGSSSTTTVIAAVVGSVVGVAVIAGTVLGVFYLRYRRVKTAVADDRKPPPGGAAGSGGEPGAAGTAGTGDDELSGGGSGQVIELSSGGGGSPLAAAGCDGSTDSAGSQSAHGSFAMREGHPGTAQLAALMAATGQAQALAARGAPGGQANGSSGAWDGSGGSSGEQQPSPFAAAGSRSLPGSGASMPSPGSHVPAAVAVAGALPPASRSTTGSGSQSSWEAAQYQLQYHTQRYQQQLAPQVEVEVALQDEQLPGSGGEGAMVVEVQRAVSLGSGRGALPPSMQQAGTARELLEVFARMYSQRPAVDYTVVAQMLDQEEDPAAVQAAEVADEERLRRIDAEAARFRSATHSQSRTASGPASGGTGPYSGHSAAPYSGGSGVGITVAAAPAAAFDGNLAAAAAAWLQGQQPAEQQQAGAVPAAGAVQGPAAVPGSSALEQEQSLLPGMLSPAGSLLPPPSNWALQPEEVEICKRPDGTYWQLGTGAFGTCYKGLYHGEQLVAVKVLHRVEERRRGEEFEREVALLKDLRDRNIVQFIGACLDGPTPMLVTEFMEFGDLWRALPLKNPAGQRIFAWHKRGRRVLYDVARGLHYLHQRRIVHLDLKSANILLSRHGTAKICDIGMARVLGNKEYLSMLSGMGTFAWSAPEVLSGRRCTEKVDLYSFGVVIWEVCTGDVPVRGEMRPLSAPADCPQEMVDLYERCIAELPEQRPTAAELLQVLSALV